MHSILSFRIYSYRAHQESFLTYQRVETYSTVSQCCTGYVGTPPSCQGKYMYLSVEYIKHLCYIAN